MRIAAAVIVGYVVMLALVFLTFSGLYLAIGADRAFQPGVYEPSTLWLASSLTLSLVCAVLGGMACAKIGGSRSVRFLALLVIVLGIAFAWPALNPSADTRPTVRTGDVPNMEAMMNARQPVWVALALPVLGAVGVLIGGARHTRN